MGQIQVETCEIEGLKIITPTVHGDERGYFMETYNQRDFEEAGIDCTFVQDNQSSSRYGVLRGLHFQINYPQDKLVRVVSGTVFDVAVDLREGSPTFGRWHGEILSAENKKQFFIPKNFAHGFSFCLSRLSLPTSAQIFIIRMMREASPGTIRTSVLTGR